MKTDPVNIIGARPYAAVREACHRLKNYGERALGAPTRQAFFEMFPLRVDELRPLVEAVPPHAMLIPVPGHLGAATYTKALAWAVLALCPKKKVFVCDCLEGPQRESLCTLKQKGIPTDDVPVVFRVKEGLMNVLGDISSLMERNVPVIVDNVVDSGRTAKAAMKALGFDCPVLAVGNTGQAEPAKTLTP